MTQATDDQQAITETVARFFHLVDTGEWTSARVLLTDPIEIAHGAHHEELSRDEAMSAWKEAHTRFAATHYQLTPPSIELTSHDQATARCDSHATFLFPDDADEPMMTIDGQYTIRLERTHGNWRIRSIRHDET